MHEPPYRIKNFVIGTIILWFGSIANVPSGWHLCNGNMGTPDLQNQFVVGAGDTYAVGASGGVVNHNHHIVANASIGVGANHRERLSTQTHLPPYHALSYIMKVN